MSVKMTSPRVLRTGRPLSLEAIRQVAPAVFAEEAHHTRGERYLYVPTIRPLQQMLDSGWVVMEARQQRARAEDRDPYTKHMLRLRKESDLNFRARDVGDGVPEVVLINAHDGTAAYHLYAGFFRLVCSNGMMVGTNIAGFKVRHTKSAQTSLDVLEAGERTITEKFPQMMDQIDVMRVRKLRPEQQYRLAERALKLRYGPTLPPFPATDLLQTRRQEDAQDTAWNVLNRVQENVMNGGWETRSPLYGRRSAVRPVERVSVVAKLNSGLWDEAMALAAE